MLPVFKDDNQPFQLMQTKWKSELDPVLDNPILAGRQINNISISSGSAAVVNHRLGRKQQGYILVSVNAPAKIAQIVAFNDKTLTLSSDASVIVSAWVY